MSSKKLLSLVLGKHSDSEAHLVGPQKHISRIAFTLKVIAIKSVYSLAQSCQSIYLSQLCGQIVRIANGYVAMGSFLTEISEMSKRLWFHQGGMSRSTGGGWDDATKHQGRRCHKISQEPWHAPAALMAKPDVTRQPGRQGRSRWDQMALKLVLKGK